MHYTLLGNMKNSRKVIFSIFKIIVLDALFLQGDISIKEYILKRPEEQTIPKSYKLCSKLGH